MLPIWYKISPLFISITTPSSELDEDDEALHEINDAATRGLGGLSTALLRAIDLKPSLSTKLFSASNQPF